MDLTIIENLANQLDIHLERYQKLIDFLNDERHCLLGLDLDGLLRISQHKERVATGITESIRQLTEYVDQASLMLGLPEDQTPTLAEVAALCPKPYDNRLNDGAIKLARLKNVISMENEANRHFIDYSLGLINESLNVLTGADQIKADGYQKDGKKDKSVKKALPTKLSKEV
ncbi:MAG: flagellar protein FlgN [Deltaproteobacteria bacterium]|nr:flagellar protein FlgN [Deltaproteobacteria bacterium]